MVHAQIIYAPGGPEALVWSPVEVGVPGAGMVRIRQRAVGLNYIDVYHRNGTYKLASLPAIIGMEGAGDVVAVGVDVVGVGVGDRVAYAGALGGYAEERLIAADRLVLLPDAIGYDTAAAMLLQGMTVRYLFAETFHVRPETVMLFHAAAGGVGLIACQWARALGATLIGTVSSNEKAELALAHGAAHVIVTSREEILPRVREITSGRGCDVVYDSIGCDTFGTSLDCLKPQGLMVSFGNASGPVPPVDLALLKGSLFVTRPSLMAYTADAQALRANAADLFAMVSRGDVKIRINQRYPLARAGDAHRDLEARKTTGSTILTV